MGRIAAEEAAIDAEMRGHAVMHAIGREPVQLFDFDPQQRFQRRTHRVEASAGRCLRRHDADQPLHAARTHRQHQREGVGAEMGDQIVVDRAGGAHIGHVIQVVVGAAAEIELERFAHPATGAVAAAQIRAAAGDTFAVAFQHRAYTPFILGEGFQFGVPLHLDAVGAQLLDQEALMIVLRKSQHERVGAEAGADVLERQHGDIVAVFTQVNGVDLDAKVDHHVGKPQLAVEFQRARMHGHRAGGLAGAAVLVDDAHSDAAPRQGYGEHQAGGAGADNEHLSSHEISLHPRRFVVRAIDGHGFHATAIICAIYLTYFLMR